MVKFIKWITFLPATAVILIISLIVVVFLILESICNWVVKTLNTVSSYIAHFYDTPSPTFKYYEDGVN